MNQYCDSCGKTATRMMFLEVLTAKIGGGDRGQRKQLTVALCDGCANRAARTLARDMEQRERVARALTDETRQVRKEEAWERRKKMIAERQANA